MLEYTACNVINGVTVYEHFLKDYNTHNILMPSLFKKKIIGVTVHNTDRISTNTGYTQSEQYTLATQNGNMKDVRVHFYVDDVCAWQNLDFDMQGWHAADGGGNGNTATIAIECIMDSSGRNTEHNQKASDNCARLAAYLLKLFGCTVNEGLFTHTHWLNVRDGVTGTIDYLNTKSHPYKTCPLYIIPWWMDFKKQVQQYYNTTDVTSIQSQDMSKFFCFPIQDNVNVVRKTYGGHDTPGNYCKVDIQCTSGTSVYSMCDGEVQSWGLDSSGNSILVIASNDTGYYRHFKQNTIYFRYIHMKECAVTSGQVFKGQYIGKSGGASGDYGQGTSTGAHLHVDITLLSGAAIFPNIPELENYCSKWDEYNQTFPGSNVNAQGKYPYMIFLKNPVQIVGDIISGGGVPGSNPNVSLNVDINNDSNNALKCAIGVVAYEVGISYKNNPTFWGCTEAYARCARNRTLGGANLKSTTLGWLGGNLSYKESEMVDLYYNIHNNFPEFEIYVTNVLNGYDYFELENIVLKYGEYLQNFTEQELYSLTGFGAGPNYFVKNYSVASTLGSDNHSTIYFQKWEYTTGLDNSKKPRL